MGVCSQEAIPYPACYAGDRPLEARVLCLVGSLLDGSLIFHGPCFVLQRSTQRGRIERKGRFP